MARGCPTAANRLRFRSPRCHIELMWQPLDAGHREWLRAQDLSPRGVAVHRRRIAYYAGSPDVKIPSKPFRYVVEEIWKRGADYLIVNEEDSQDYPWLVEELPTRARLLHREAAHGQTASVYLLLRRKDYPREPAPRRP